MEERRDGKPQPTFYCRDWVFEKLRACLDKRGSSPTCGTLIMGDSGCGKTTLCSELVSPSKITPTKASLSKRLLGYHFCSIVDSQSLSLAHFLRSLTRQLANHSLIGEAYQKQSRSKQRDSRLSHSSTHNADEYMIKQIVEPLNSLRTPPSTVHFLLVDGLDECDDSLPANDTHSQSIPQLLSRHHQNLPRWIALVCTCSSKAKRVSRLFTGFRKLSLDDITRSHVIQDIQQYILHRLDCEESLKRHLNKNTAEILDKLHVKCNGCILYIELILDLVAQRSVSLEEVNAIPGTLVGLYMWICQRLFPDITHYLSLVRPVFNILLASRQPLTAEQIYNSLITRNRRVKWESFSDCLDRVGQILLTTANHEITFCHHSFRLWLLDVKFCSRTYLCDPREGHEMLTLYHTVLGRSLDSLGVREFAYHIHRCNATSRPQEPGGGNKLQTSDVSSSGERRDLTLHEQAVWMLLSGADLQNPEPSTNDCVRTATAGCMLNEREDHSSSSSQSQSHKNEDDSPAATNNKATTASSQEGSGDISAHPLTLQALASNNTGTDTENNGNRALADDVQILTDVELPTEEMVYTAPPATIQTGCVDEGKAKIELDRDMSITHQERVGQSNMTVSDVLAPDVGVSDVLAPYVVGDSEADSEEDVLECLDEDLQSGDGNVDSVTDSEREIISSPVEDANDPLLPHHPDAGTQGSAAAVEGLTSATLEEALANSDLEWLERALADGLDVNIVDGDGRAPLILACSTGQLQVVEMLILMAGAEVNLPDSQQKTALSVASWFGHDSIVKFLLNNDADVNRLDHEGRSPLLAACYMGHSDVVEQLIANGADVNYKDPDGKTPLCVACSCDLLESNQAEHAEVVEALFKAGCDANTPDISLQTPLHYASHNGSAQVCGTLLSFDVAVDAVDKFQRTPLMCAVAMGHVKVVEMLLVAGADVYHLDQDGRNCLGIACLAGHDKIIIKFLEMGQDEMHRDNSGIDCLHFSASEGHAQALSTLLDYGADINSQDDQGRTALFLAAQQGRQEALTVLISRGADVNLPAHNGKTPLRVACTCESTSCASVLLRYGADVNHRDMEGRSIIYLLALENKPACIQMLAEAGADVNAVDEEGRAALHVACWQGHVEVVTSLLRLDAIDIDSLDNEKRTSLQSACWQGHAHITNMLCERGANVNHMCDQGATPLCIAAQEGFLEVVSVLCNHGADPNHCDRFGRTALKIAMKANNDPMLHLIENIMRRYKPASRINPQVSRSARKSIFDESEAGVYENCTNRSNQSSQSSAELATPYAVISLPLVTSSAKGSPGPIMRGIGPTRGSPRLTQKGVDSAQRDSASRLSAAPSSLNNSSWSAQKTSQHSENSGQKLRLTAQHFTGLLSPQSVTGETPQQSIVESQHKKSLEFQQLQSAARYKQMCSVAKISQLQHVTKTQRQSAEPHQLLSTECIQQGHTASVRSLAMPATASDESSETSEGCDTAPSTISSAGEDKSSPTSSRSTTPPQNDTGSVRAITRELVQLGNGATPPRLCTGRLDLILNGEVGYMANPRINKALYTAANMVPTDERVPSTRPSAKNILGGSSKSSRQQNKHSSGKHKMTAIQNTARTPAYKVQYAAAEHPQQRQFPAHYAVRNDELLSAAEHSLCSVKSRSARIVSSSEVRSLADGPTSTTTSLTDASRCSPPPLLPPRKGRQSQPLHSNIQLGKPTIVGVVRPRAQLPMSQVEVESPSHRSGQKETSL